VTADAGRVGLTHEALLRSWPRLGELLEHRDLVAGVLEHLADASHGWDQRGRHDEDLYRGARLEAALEAQRSAHTELTPLEVAFVLASHDRAEEDRLADRRRADRETRNRRRLAWVAAGLAAAVVVSMLAGGLALQARRSATRSETLAVAGRLAALSSAATDTRTAALLAVAAYRTQDTAATRSALLDVLERHDGARWHVDLPTAPNALVVAGSKVWVSDGYTLHAVDVVSGRVTSTAPAPVSRIDAVTPSGDLLGRGSGQPLVAHDASPVTVLSGADLAVKHLLRARALGTDTTDRGLALTPDGRWLAVVRAGRGLYPESPVSRALLYDLTAPGAAPRQLPAPGPITSAVAAAHEVVLLTRTGAVETVDLPSGRIMAVGHPGLLRGGVREVALSPDGRRLVMTSQDQPTRPFVLDPRRPAGPPQFLESEARPVLALAFSASGRRLAVATASGRTTVYDPRTDVPVATLTGNAAPVQAVAWSPTSDARLYTADQLDQVTAWDVGGRGRLVAMTGPDRPNIGRVSQFGDVVAGETPWAYGPQDDLFTLDLRTGTQHRWRLGLATQEGVNQVDLDASRTRALVSEEEQNGHNHFVVRDLASGRLVDRFDPPPGSADTIPLLAALAPSGQTAYVGLDRHRIGVLTLGSHRLVRTLTPLFPGGSRLQVVPWAFDPAGRLLVWCYDPGPTAGDRDRSPTNFRLGVVDPASGRLLAQHALGDANPGALGWSRDGRLLAVGSTTGQLVLLDATTLRPVTAPVTAGANGISTVSFAPDGRTVATGGGDSEARLWSVPRLDPVGGPLAPDDPRSDTPAYAWFSPSGSLVGLFPAGSGTVRWGSAEASPAAWVPAACALAGSDLTRTEWQRAVGDRPFRPVCPH
jgi:WD40 repeat protein